MSASGEVDGGVHFLLSGWAEAALTREDGACVTHHPARIQREVIRTASATSAHDDLAEALRRRWAGN